MKVFPERKQFVSLAKKHNLIVLSHVFPCDWLTPTSAYWNVRRFFRGERFLLESVEGAEKFSRFSCIGFAPLQTFRSKGSRITLRGLRQKTFTTKHDPLFELAALMDMFQPAPAEHVHFFGGFVGFAGYDIVRFYEPIGKPAPDTLQAPDAYFILPKYFLIFDHLKKQIEALVFVPISGSVPAGTVFARELSALESMLASVTKPCAMPQLAMQQKKLPVREEFKKSGFLKAVGKLKNHIRQGDIIQAVLSRRMSVPFSGDSFAAYRQLRILNPSPYMFYLDFEGLQLAGSSPEMLLRLENKTLITRPIAGTRPRGATERADEFLEKDLLADTKEVAEHIMLVDLARNDVGRVAQKGTVTVPQFMSVERFSHVMHIVSEVRAKARAHASLVQALAACFPAGTLSGAPKVRAMQLINTYEPVSRGIYGGCVGYFSFTKSLDTCIIIRTIIFKNNRAYIQAGAGIVNDSVPEKEFIETANKARAQLVAVQLAQGHNPRKKG